MQTSDPPAASTQARWTMANTHGRAGAPFRHGEPAGETFPSDGRGRVTVSEPMREAPAMDGCGGRDQARCVGNHPSRRRRMAMDGFGRCEQERCGGNHPSKRRGGGLGMALPADRASGVMKRRRNRTRRRIAPVVAWFQPEGAEGRVSLRGDSRPDSHHLTTSSEIPPSVPPLFDGASRANRLHGAALSDLSAQTQSAEAKLSLIHI